MTKKCKSFLEKNEVIMFTRGQNSRGSKFTDYFVYNKDTKIKNFLGIGGIGQEKAINTLKMRNAYDNF